MRRLNGNTHVWVGVLVTVAAQAIAVGIVLGALQAHVGDKQIHETTTEKEQRIDSRIRLFMAPVDMKLDNIERMVEENRADLKAIRNNHGSD